jgi:hypothetical protein
MVVTGALTNTGTGTITVTNLGPAIAVGDRFVLFSEAVSNGAALTIAGAGINWTNYLAVDGSIQALSVVSSIILPTNIPAITNFSLAGANITLKGTNGDTGATYYLLMTTNLTKPRNQWRTVATNVAGGGNYSFTDTNVVTPALGLQFYMLSSTNYNP